MFADEAVRCTKCRKVRRSLNRWRGETTKTRKLSWKEKRKIIKNKQKNLTSLLAFTELIIVVSLWCFPSVRQGGSMEWSDSLMASLLHCEVGGSEIESRMNNLRSRKTLRNLQWTVQANPGWAFYQASGWRGKLAQPTTERKIDFVMNNKNNRNLHHKAFERRKVYRWKCNLSFHRIERCFIFVTPFQCKKLSFDVI